MSGEESTYKCGAYVTQLLSLTDDNTFVRSLGSASTSEIGKMLSPNREPVLAELDNDSRSVS
jgi:type IV pilus biogenesis protein CpaD/CtpE